MGGSEEMTNLFGELVNVPYDTAGCDELDIPLDYWP